MQVHAHPRPASQQHNLPHLPNELWHEILAHVHPAELWLNVRKVSTAFRERVDHLWRSDIVPNLRLTLNLLWSWRPRGRRWWFLAAVPQDEEGRRSQEDVCIFRLEECSEVPEVELFLRHGVLMAKRKLCEDHEVEDLHEGGHGVFMAQNNLYADWELENLSKPEEQIQGFSASVTSYRPSKAAKKLEVAFRRGVLQHWGPGRFVRVCGWCMYASAFRLVDERTIACEWAQMFNADCERLFGLMIRDPPLSDKYGNDSSTDKSSGGSVSNSDSEATSDGF